MNRSTPIVPLLIAALLLGGCGWSNAFKATRTQTETVAHVADSALDVSTRNGRVEIVGDSAATEVEITAEIVARGRTQQEADERLAATTLAIERRSDGTLAIEPVFPASLAGGGDGASFAIRLPDARGVTVRTGNGRVIARNLAGELWVDTSNGRIIVENHDGPAVLDTSNGRIEVTGLNGSLEADTSNGDVTVHQVRGPVRLDTSNGGVDVALAPDQRGPIQVDTSNGGVTVAVGAAFEGLVTLDTSNGGISLDIPPHVARRIQTHDDYAEVELGDGSAAHVSRIKSSNGRITFRIAN